MTNYDRGVQYENLVSSVYGAILTAEASDSRIRSIDLEMRKQIRGTAGNTNEIDIYWEHEIAGVVHKTAIECKAPSSGNVPVSDVRDFAYKLGDIGGIKGLLVTPTGFSSGAKDVARAESIDLITIREYRDGDREGLLNQISLTMHAQFPAQCTNIVPRFDARWMLSQGYHDGEQIRLDERNDRIVIQDRAAEFQKTIFQLESERFGNQPPGAGTWERELADGWLLVGDDEFKVDAVKLEFVIPAVHTSEMEIDLTAHILAIVEYVDRRAPGPARFEVYRDGTRAPLPHSDPTD